MEQYINQLAEIMEEAPGRNEESELFAQFKPLFEENRGYLDIVRGSLELPIKVVLMGEVKAGKSTLINSILGRRLSRVSVLEATSAIYHFYYSEVEECSVITKNGRFKLQDVDKLVEMLEERNGDNAFIKECTNIEIGLNLPILKQFDLIDTPGLGTVTDSNEEITKRYIPWSDIVVWVFNSNYIGQQNIRDYIFDIKDQGKEIIGVLNRIDEVNVSSEEIVESARRDIPELGTYIPLSAYQELEAVESGLVYETSGVRYLLETIKAEIGEDLEKKKREVVTQSLISLIEREMGYHDEMIQISKHVQKMMDEYEISIHKIHEEISEEIQEKFISWIKYGFLSDEIREINQKKITLEELRKIEENSLSEAYINQVTSEQINNFCQQLEEGWKQRVKRLDEDCLEELRRFAEHLHIEQAKLYSSTQIFSDKKESTEEDLVPIVEEVKDRTALKDSLWDSVKIGSALTGYMAFLGPTAASISVISAAITVFPVVLAGGLAVGYLRTAYEEHNGKKEVEAYQGELLEKIRSIKNVLIESDLVTGHHFNVLSAQVEEQLLNQFMNQSSMKTPLELEGLVKQLEEGLAPYQALQVLLVERLEASKYAESEVVDYKDFNIDDLLG
ncbi:MAG: GTP-binding protein [Cellulosilyticum sp.]|nr:GTP-binding protein [Cellulosilyticum sp.]